MSYLPTRAPSLLSFPSFLPLKDLPGVISPYKNWVASSLGFHIQPCAYKSDPVFGFLTICLARKSGSSFCGFSYFQLIAFSSSSWLWAWVRDCRPRSGFISFVLEPCRMPSGWSVPLAICYSPLYFRSAQTGDLIHEGSCPLPWTELCQVRTSPSTPLVITNAVKAVCSSALHLQPLNIPQTCVTPWIWRSPGSLLPSDGAENICVNSLFYTSCSWKYSPACLSTALHSTWHPALFWLPSPATPWLWKDSFWVPSLLCCLTSPFLGL